MRLAHFLPTFPQMGGVGAVVGAMLEAGQARGDVAEVVSYRNDEDGIGRRHLAQWPYEVLPCPRHLPGDRAAARLTDSPEFDAVVFHGVFTPPCARLARAVAAKTSAAVVAFPHDPYNAALFGTKRARKQLYWSMFERRYLAGSDLIQVTAPSHADLLRQLGVRVPILVAPNGLRPSEIEAADAVRAARVQPGSRPEGSHPLKCLYLGRWDVFEKSLDLLIEAIGSSPGLRSSIKLCIAGPEIGARAELETLLRVNGVTAVDLVGFVPSIWTLLEEADCLLLPSRKEGFGMVALQALAASVPVMISADSGLAEYVGPAEGAVITRPEVGAIRSALEQIVEERDVLADRAIAGADRIAADFSWIRTLDLLAEEINGRRSCRAGESAP